MVDYAESQIAAALAAGNAGRARLWQHIKAEVDKAPPLGEAQRDQLSVLLRPGLPDRMPPRPPKPVARRASAPRAPDVAPAA